MREGGREGGGKGEGRMKRCVTRQGGEKRVTITTKTEVATNRIVHDRHT